MKLENLKGKLSRKYWRTFGRQEIFLVYTMGKVGSSTIYETIKANARYPNAFHTHFLSDYWLEEKLPNGSKFFHGIIQRGLKIREFIANNPDKRLKVITLTREPIIRAVSNLFQNWGNFYDDIEKVSRDELINHVQTRDHRYTLEWFDTEFKNFLDFDIYSQPFDQLKGYQIYETDNADILCIQLEKLNQVKSEAMAEFIGEDLNVINTNTSAGKSTAEKYDYLRKELKIDPQILEELYVSKYMQHFYSTEDIVSFKHNWSG